MCIKNLSAQLSWTLFFWSDKKTCAKTKWKHICRIHFFMCIKKVMWIWAIGWHTRTNLFSLHCICFCHSWMPKPKSVVKVVRYKFLPELSFMTAFPNSRHPPSKATEHVFFYCISSARSEAQVIYEWNCSFLLLQMTFFLVIFGTSLSGKDFFMPLDENGAVFANVLCDIPILPINKICNFGWKHS